MRKMLLSAVMMTLQIGLIDGRHHICFGVSCHLFYDTIRHYLYVNDTENCSSDPVEDLYDFIIFTHV